MQGVTAGKSTPYIIFIIITYFKQKEDFMSKNIYTILLKEQCADTLLPSEIKVKILSEGGQIWIQPDGFGGKCAMDGEGYPIGIEIWQGRLRLIIFDDINSEDPQIIDLENARETCRLDND